MYGDTNYLINTFKKVIKLSGYFFAGIFLFSSIVLANPEGGQVSAGSATISSPNSTTVQINQSSDKAVIDWRSYNIAPNETTHYQQPAASSITLNRISPNMGASQINGSITANGQVWLINPAGIVFGPSARVDVAGFLATTANISNQDFMAGNYHFVQSPDWNVGIVNQGKITVRDEGLVALVAPGVENSGVIKANYGKVTLAAGTEFVVDLYGDQLINFGVNSTVTKAATDPRTNQPMKDGVNNSGAIISHGGKVMITAQTAEGIVDNSINMSGYVIANSAVQRGGSIILSGGDHNTVKVSGKLLATSKRSSGGTVKVLGKQIVLTNKARINVSGATGGGTVLIGGNTHGGGPEYNADYTYVSSGAVIKANALTNGDGGKVVVWSNIATNFYGLIEANGGVYSGNGGFVETSGGYLDITNAVVTALAKNGTMGTWLLDPTNIWIAASQANATAAGMQTTDTSANTGSGGNPNTFAGSGTIFDSLLTTGNLQTALGTANVIVTTTNASGTGVGNITVVDPITWSSTNTLTLTAANNIAINGAITTGAAGSALILNAAGTVTQTAAIGGSGGLTQSGAGTVILSQANNYTGTTTISAGTLQVGNGGTTGSLGTGSVTDTASLVFNLSSATSVSNAISGTGGTLTQNGTLTLTLTGSNSYTGTTTINGGLTLSGASGALTGTTNIIVNQGGTFTLDNFTSGNLGTRVNDSSNLTMAGGEFKFLGSSSGPSSETMNTLNLSSGYSTITMVSNGGGTTSVLFAGANRTAGATVLFRGDNLGGTAGTTTTNINFTSATGLNLAGTNNSQTNKTIVPYAFGDTSSSGNGTSFVTYNIAPGSNSGNTTGIRPLVLTGGVGTQEYVLDALSSGNNIELTTGTTSAVTNNLSINSLLLPFF